MTPEERAIRAVEKWLGDRWPRDGFSEFRGTGPLRDAIAAEIVEAVAAAREACAKIAEEWHTRRLVILEYPDQHGDPPPAGPRIAAAIRARSAI